MFIDCGQHINKDLVRTGVGLCEAARATVRNGSLFVSATYNLANGLLALHEMQSGAEVFAVRLDAELQRITSLYYEAMDSAEQVSVQAKLNFASALQRQGRSVEAMDLALDTIIEEPTFARGWSTSADVIWGVATFYTGDVALLIDAVQRYNHALFLETHDRVYRGMVQSNRDRLASLIPEIPSSHPELEGWPHRRARIVKRTLSWSGGLPAFIWRSGLGLNLCSGCRALRKGGYDRFPLPAHLVSTTDERARYLQPAEISALIQGYIGARALLWLSRSSAGQSIKILHQVIDTADFSRRSAFLAAALREAYGVLDRVAAIVNRQFNFGLGQRQVSFENLFFARRKKKLVFRSDRDYPQLVGLRALLHLSASFEISAGRFGSLRSLRNELQHSIVVPVKLNTATGFGNWRTISSGELEGRAFDLLRLARAAIIYVAGAVYQRNRADLAGLKRCGVAVGRGRMPVKRDE